MYTQVPLLLFLLANTGVSEAGWSPGSISRVASHAHQRAARRSASLARDIRLSFNGIFAVEQNSTQAVANSRMYCVNQPASFPQGNNTGSGTSTIVFGATSTGGPRATSRPTGTATATGSGATPSSTLPASDWVMQESWQGQTFFDNWEFWVPDAGNGDPTHGNVDYINQDVAEQQGLVNINADGNAILRVEATAQVSGNRQSVRLESLNPFNGGLVILDAVHMPTGCGIWPAFWTNGPSWPYTGEIDIVEGINDNTNDQATLHTTSGCTIPNNVGSSMSGSVLSTDCNVLGGSNEGCGTRASATNSFGAPFNSNGGGVYAMSWTDEGVAVYFFPRGSIPADITANNPLPDSWGKPVAFWPASSCDPWKIFANHKVIINTTLCGDWAGSAWTASGTPGQEQSCAARTGVATCTDFIRQNGAAMKEAYWEIKYVQRYRQR